MSTMLHNNARDAYVITPNDTPNLTTNKGAIGLYIGGTGTVTVVTEQGNTVLFTAVPVGAILPVRVRSVNATGTTASLIVGFLP